MATKKLTGIVKNGSTSYKADQENARRRFEAKQRRDAEKERFDIARSNPIEAKIHSRDFGAGNQYPKVVIGLKHPKDGEVLDWVICEIVTDSDDAKGLSIIMACPRCVRTHGRPSDESQMRISQKNRMFHLDQRTKDQRQMNPILKFCAGEVWINPENRNEYVIIAGMVTTDDWCTCSTCGWSFKLDDSVCHSR